MAAEEQQRLIALQRVGRLGLKIWLDVAVEKGEHPIGQAADEPAQELPMEPFESRRTHPQSEAAEQPKPAARDEHRELAGEVCDHEAYEQDGLRAPGDGGEDRRDREQQRAEREAHGRHHEPGRDRQRASNGCGWHHCSWR